MRLGFVDRKKSLCSRLPLSLLLNTCPMVHLVMGSLTIRVGIQVLAASVGGEEMNLDTCHMLVSSSPSNQSIECSALAFFMCSKYLFCC